MTVSMMRYSPTRIRRPVRPLEGANGGRPWILSQQDRRSGSVRELGGEGPDGAEGAVHQNDRSVDRTVGEDGAVRGDAGDAEAGAGLVADLAG